MPTMTAKASIPTMDALRSFSFRPDPTAISYDPSTITFDFGILKLTATKCLNLRAQQIVLLSGVISTPRSLGQVQFELPQQMESRQLCAALIAYNLDQFPEFKAIHCFDWLEEGRRNRTLLPWVRAMGEWDARPSCMVEREWLRLALNKLEEHISALTDEANVVFGFDGSVLSIRCDGKTIALAAEGTRWAVSVTAQAGKLRRLPKRLTRDPVWISIWQSHIHIDNWIYPVVIDGSGSGATRPAQPQ